MGTLADLGIVGSDTAEAGSRSSFRQETVQAIRTGEVRLFGVLISEVAGGPIPMPLLIPPFNEQAAQALEDFPDDFENQTADAMIEAYKLIDAIPASNIAAPVTDYTFPILPVIKFILEILALLKVPDPPAWIIVKIPQIIAKAPEFLEAIEQLASECKSEKLVKFFKDLDPELDEAELKANLEKEIGSTGKTLCELIPFPIPLPPFPPKLPTLPVPFMFPLNWPAFGLPGISIPVPMITLGIPTIGWPQWPPPWHWIFTLHIIPAIIAFINMIAQFIAELIAAILEGIEALILKLIELMIKYIIMPVMEAIGDILEKFITLAASIAVFFKNIFAALIVSIIGLILGAGFFAWGGAYLLGILPA